MTVRPIALCIACGITAALAACSAPPAPTQEAATPAPAAASGSETVRGDLIKDWTNQKETLMKIADAMPEDKFGYKSTPPQRTYAEQIMHIATVNVSLLKLVGGAAPVPTFTAETAKTKAEILKALGDSYDYGIALLNEHTDANVMDTVEAGFMGPSTKARVFWFLLAHSMDTYGQMAVYLRLNGVIPPASRGV
jgi:uncharacterized damage-inducible protein DinB